MIWLRTRIGPWSALICLIGFVLGADAGLFADPSSAALGHGGGFMFGMAMLPGVDAALFLDIYYNCGSFTGVLGPYLMRLAFDMASYCYW